MSTMVLKEDIVEISLMELKRYIGLLVPGTNFELVIIRYYKYIVTKDNNMITNINNYICNKLSMTSGVEYNYSDLTTFVYDNNYINAMYTFIGKLEKILFSKSKLNIYDIEYHELVDKDNLVFKFKYKYLE